MLDAEGVALREGAEEGGRRVAGDGVGEEEVWASVEVQFGVHHLVEIRVAHRRVVGAVVEDRRRRAEKRLVPGVEHHVAAHAVRHADERGGEDVAIHLRMPHRLLAPHRLRRLGRVGGQPHRLAEEGVGLLVAEGAHLLRVLEPQRRDRAEVLLVEDVEAAHLREPPLQLLRDEALGEAVRRAVEVGVLGRDDVAAPRAERRRLDRLAHHHVGVEHQHVVLVDLCRREPRHHRVRLVVARVPLLVDERVVAHVAVDEGRADLEVRLRVLGLLRLAAREQPRDVAVLAARVERVEEADRVPVEERRALGAEDDVQRRARRRRRQQAEHLRQMQSPASRCRSQRKLGRGDGGRYESRR